MIVFLSFVLLSATAFGQGASASLTGVVTDPSGGVVSGASVGARNVDTGIQSSITSDGSGRYRFPSLLAGSYQISVEAPGFSPYLTNQRLTVASQNTLNIALVVAGSVTEISVTGVTESIMIESSASTGVLMQEDLLESVPMLSTNVMDLVNLMGGVTPTSDPSLNPGAQTFAGVAARNINIQRDGLSVNEVSMNIGINSSMNINTDLISEFKMILSPVDAEMGRGAGQIQMTTRTGSNAYRGSATWSGQNTALDSKDFSTKMSGGVNGPPWRNLNNYILTFSGPVLKNRTFFFATWEQQISRVKLEYTARAMTNCAKMGIYRYIGGATPGAARENNSMNVVETNGSMPSVDSLGNILELGTNQTFMMNSGDNRGEKFSYAQAHPSALNGGMRVGDGVLHFESIFGPLTNEARNLINQDVRDVLNPCAQFAQSGLWNPTANQFGTNGLWDERPWGVGNDGRDGRAYRVPFDDTGYVNRFTYDLNDGSNIRMPPVNYWMGNGDGLNIASHRWTRSGIGGREGTIYGTGGDPDRKSITIRLDHQINNDHRASFTFTREDFKTDEHEAIWPAEYGGMGGLITRNPRNYSGTLMSTLRPTLLNEFRMGYMKAGTSTHSAIEYSPELRDSLEYLMPKNQTQGLMTLIGIGEGSMDFFTDSQTYNWESHPVGSRGNISASQLRDDARISFADTVTWMKGSHSFKGGIEYRRQSSTQAVDGSLQFGRALSYGAANGAVSGWPAIFGGTVSGTGDRRTGILGQHPLTLAGDAWTNLHARPNASRDCHRTQCANQNQQGTAGIFSTPYQMMTYFSGSISQVNQYFFMVPDESKAYGARWNDASNPNELIYSNDIINQEISFFFKDDWKVNRDLTLNLGVRWEYYGVPHAANGRTISMKGGSKSIWGLATPLDDPMRFLLDKSLPEAYQNLPYGSIINGSEATTLPTTTQYEYIGNGTSNPDRMAWNRDLNNFAPHLGFSWALPWLGRGKTTLRGGWSISYSSIGQQDTLNDYVANVAAAQPFYTSTFNGEVRDSSQTYNNFGTSMHYMDLASLNYNDSNYALPMQVRGGREPMKPLTAGYFSGTVEAIDENLQNAMTHSLNLSVTHNLTRFLTLDIRYVGTLGRNSVGTYNINNNDFIVNGLWKELEKIRNDVNYQSDMINSLLPRGAYSTTMRTTYPTLSGSDQLRHRSGAASNLVARNYSAIASTFATGNGGYTADPILGESAMIFRYGCLPELRTNPNGDMASLERNDMANPCVTHTPLNFYRNNPQHGTANLRTNTDTKSNYSSMQMQVTMRPTHGLNFQATWTWAKTMSYNSWNNYLETDRYWTSGGPSHTLGIFGAYTLPFGPRGYLFRDSSSLVRKVVEGWQIGWIANIRSGSRLSLTGTSTQWGNSWPIAVRPDLLDDLAKAGKMEEIWTDDGVFAGGRYFTDYKWTRVMDPGLCGNVDTTLYNDACYDTSTNLLRGTNRALALADPRRQSEKYPLDPLTAAPWALLYEEDTMGADGVLYKKGTPVILLRNATGTMGDEIFDPLKTGNYKGSKINGPGSWSLDANLQKSFELMENKQLELRIDAANILNRAELTGTAPGSQRYMYGGRQVTTSAMTGFSLNAAGETISAYAGKVGHRTFQARLRLSF